MKTGLKIELKRIENCFHVVLLMMGCVCILGLRIFRIFS